LRRGGVAPTPQIQFLRNEANSTPRGRVAAARGKRMYRIVIGGARFGTAPA